ncbi:MAG: GAF domain-containing protein [Bacteroidia bacterium]
MSESITVSGDSKKEKYESLLPQIKALVEGEADFIANISNIVAALKYGMDFFWVGVYFVKISSKGGQELVLGPFQGPVACTRIAFGRGVCGTAWKERKTIIVEDVDKFPNHIACSSDSKSEIVVPCFKNTEVMAVLDVDSDKLNDFDTTDKKYLEMITQIIERLEV